MKTLKLILILLFIFGYTHSDFAQVPEDAPYCEDDASLAAFDIVYKTPDNGRYLKVLIIYVNFPDDDFQGPDPPENIWEPPWNGEDDPIATKPMNYYHQDGRMIDPSEVSNTVAFMDRYSEYTYSDWFCEMSMGTYDVIGDEVSVLLSHPSTYYKNNNVLYGTISLEAVNLADAEGVNFADYDNWNNSTHAWGADGKVDFILIQYRRVPNNANNWFYQDTRVGGSTLIGFSTTLDSKTIDRGVWGIAGPTNTTHTELIMEHEFCHYIFGDYFDHPGINPNHVIMGMMTPGHGNSTYTMTSMERCMPGLYVTPLEVDPGEGDIQNFTLEDFISTGDVLKIPIPGTSNPIEYFWVSNHQKISVYDGISRGSNACWQLNGYQQDPYCGEGAGILIFHESDPYCNNNINDGVHYPFDLEN